MKMEKKKKKERKDTWIFLIAAYEKKRERKNEHSFFLNRHYIDWKKEENKTEHFWTVIVILFWLVVKWNFLSLSLKATLEFFFLFILWNLAKTINRGFYTRFTNNCNYIDSKFFLELGFRGIGNFFFRGFCFDESVADARVGQTFIQVDLQIVVG